MYGLLSRLPEKLKQIKQEYVSKLYVYHSLYILNS